MNPYKYGWRYWKERDRMKEPVIMFNIIGDALDRSVQNALAMSRAKAAQFDNHDCHASPEDGCQACFERYGADVLDLKIDQWKEDEAELTQAMQEYECSKHGCNGQ